METATNRKKDIMEKKTPTAKDIEKKLQQQTDFIEATITKVRSGVLSDIRSLENAVQEACKDIQALPESEDRSQIEAMMVDMTGKLEELAKELLDYQERLKKNHGID